MTEQQVQLVDYEWREERDRRLHDECELDASVCAGCGCDIDTEESVMNDGVCDECCQYAYENDGRCRPMRLPGDEEDDDDWDRDQVFSEDQIFPVTKKLWEPEPMKLSFFKVKLSPGAMASIKIHSEYWMKEETGGLLFGPPGRRIVTNAPFLKNKNRSGCLYEPNPQQWFDLIQQMEKRGLELKGWWHTHPGMSPTPSGTDRQYHQLKGYMLIYNPHSGELRAFDWDKKDRTRLMEVRLCGTSKDGDLKGDNL